MVEKCYHNDFLMNLFWGREDKTRQENGGT